jgi:hypothetical protein
MLVSSEDITWRFDTITFVVTQHGLDAEVRPLLWGTVPRTVTANCLVSAYF